MVLLVVALTLCCLHWAINNPWFHHQNSLWFSCLVWRLQTSQDTVSSNLLHPGHFSCLAWKQWGCGFGLTSCSFGFVNISENQWWTAGLNDEFGLRTSLHPPPSNQYCGVSYKLPKYTAFFHTTLPPYNLQKIAKFWGIPTLPPTLFIGFFDSLSHRLQHIVIRMQNLLFH